MIPLAPRLKPRHSEIQRPNSVQDSSVQMDGSRKQETTINYFSSPSMSSHLFSSRVHVGGLAHIVGTVHSKRGSVQSHVAGRASSHHRCPERPLAARQLVARDAPETHIAMAVGPNREVTAQQARGGHRSKPKACRCPMSTTMCDLSSNDSSTLLAKRGARAYSCRTKPRAW